MIKKKYDIYMGDLIYVYPYNVWASAIDINIKLLKSLDLPEYKEELRAVLAIDPVALDHVLKTDEHFSDRDKELMTYYFLHNKTLEDLAGHYELTRERVRQIINRNLRKLRYIPAVRDQFVSVSVKRKKNDELKLREKLLNTFSSESTAYDALGIEELGLSVRTFNCCYRGGYKYIKDFIGAKVDDILRLRSMGKKSLEELLDALAVYNIVPVDGKLTFAKNSPVIVKEERKE